MHEVPSMKGRFHFRLPLIATFSLLLIQGHYAQSAEVYKWVDENGTVHFGDQPTEKAEKITVEPVVTMPFPEAPAEFKANVTEKKKVVPAYTVSIINPIHDSAFQSGNGDLFIEVKTEPALKKDDTLIYRLDGQTIYQGTALTQTTQNLDRGTHTLSIEAVTKTGKAEGSATSTFTIHRPTVIKRANN